MSNASELNDSIEEEKLEILAFNAFQDQILPNIVKNIQFRFKSGFNERLLRKNQNGRITIISIDRYYVSVKSDLMASSESNSEADSEMRNLCSPKKPILEPYPQNQAGNDAHPLIGKAPDPAKHELGGRINAIIVGNLRRMMESKGLTPEMMFPTFGLKGHRSIYKVLEYKSALDAADLVILETEFGIPAEELLKGTNKYRSKNDVINRRKFSAHLSQEIERFVDTRSAEIGDQDDTLFKIMKHVNSLLDKYDPYDVEDILKKLVKLLRSKGDIDDASEMLDFFIRRQ